MMTCKQCKKYIRAFLDDESGDHQDFLAHIAQCETCKKELEAEKMMAQILAHEKDVPVPTGFSKRWQDKVAAQKRHTISYRVLIPACAAVLCTLFVVGAVVQHNMQPHGEAVQQAVAYGAGISAKDDGIVTPVPQQEKAVSRAAIAQEESVAANNAQEESASANNAQEESASANNAQEETTIYTTQKIDAVIKKLQEYKINFTVQDLAITISADYDMEILNKLLMEFDMQPVQTINELRIVFQDQ
ncbi:MAG: hypothetical protein RR716_00200 [Christensenellaceae bacterium]